MASKNVRPTPPPKGPALVRPALGALLFGLSGMSCGDDGGGSDTEGNDSVAPMPAPTTDDSVTSIEPPMVPPMITDDGTSGSDSGSTGPIPPMPPPMITDDGTSESSSGSGSDSGSGSESGSTGPIPPMPPPMPPPDGGAAPEDQEI